MSSQKQKQKQKQKQYQPLRIESINLELSTQFIASSPLKIHENEGSHHQLSIELNDSDTDKDTIE